METLQDEKRDCRQCGASLRQHSRFCEACGAPTGPAAERSCSACGASVSTGAQFCAACGRPLGGRRTAAHAMWEQVQTRAAAVDWERVGRIALPIAALLLAGLLGYGLGRQNEESAGSRNRSVTQTQGWRAQTAAARQNKPGEETEGPVVKTPDAPLTAVRAVGPESASGPPTRFRDFQISASSYELAHPPVHASDGDPYTFWHAWQSERFKGEGEWLTLSFPTERVISRIGLLPGRMGAGARAEGRVRSILVKSGKEPPQKLLFQDRPELQYQDLKTPLRTRKLVLRVVTVVPGSETRHVVIPEVQAWGYPAPSEVARRADG